MKKGGIPFYSTSKCDKLKYTLICQIYMAITTGNKTSSKKNKEEQEPREYLSWPYKIIIPFFK